jgi:ATP/ADP translocase
MNNKIDPENLELERKRLSDLKNELILHYHQDAAFYERRTYIAFFLIAGVGLYACSDLYKKIDLRFLMPLTISAILFVIPIALSVISNEFARKKSMYKAEWFQFEHKETYKKGAAKYIKLENLFKIIIGSFFLIGSIILGILYYLGVN